MNCPHEGKTTAYAYDRGGNLLRKRIYALTKGDLPEEALQEIEYQYADAKWKDKLTAYNGVAITYDAIGNPLHDGAWAYTWQYGRQLQKMERGSSETATFAYNKDGLRIRKESSSRGITGYVLSGKQIMEVFKFFCKAPSVGEVKSIPEPEACTCHKGWRVGWKKFTKQRSAYPST